MTTVGLEQQQLLIGGEWTAASSGATFERLDPFTGDAVTVAAAAGREDARRACDAAARRSAVGRPRRRRSGESSLRRRRIC